MLLLQRLKTHYLVIINKYRNLRINLLTLGINLCKDAISSAKTLPSLAN